jgi:hypothetical protein
MFQTVKTNLKESDHFWLFKDEDLLTGKWQIFEQLPIGKFYKTLPLDELGSLLPAGATKAVGAPKWLDNKGMLGLTFLKFYLQSSDQKLVERLNTDWSVQLFCGRLFKDNQMIKDRNLPSKIRSYLSLQLDIDDFQDILMRSWKPYIEDQQCAFIDATVYESYIKYPTDVKLLWDCCAWVYESMFTLCRELGIRRPRSKYREHQLRQVDFQKKKKKTYRQNRHRINFLLKLLQKGIHLLGSIIEQYQVEMDAAFQEKFQTVKTVYYQQEFMYENYENKVADRIVSLFKPYLRPIVRGKENKGVEFGAKAHVRQIDGINIIDKLSFDPYNEAKYLKDSIIKHKKQFSQCCVVGVDKIYGTNENRKFLTKEKIHSCLPQKGRLSEDVGQKELLRSLIGTQRATVLEGSFGNEKNHYMLRKIKARNRFTEVTWILFGVMAANAVNISKRINNQCLKKAA